MTAITSAGILLVRGGSGGTPLEVLLGHMGGPFWARRDLGAWSVPKGEHRPQESATAAAAREFSEELGIPVPAGRWHELGSIKARNGKLITAWAIRADPDLSAVVFGTFTMQWPKGSGRLAEFGELDRVAWFDLPSARTRIVGGQLPFLDRLVGWLGAGLRDDSGTSAPR